MVKINKEIKENIYNSIVNYLNTSFGQIFLNYLRPICFNSMDLKTKKKVNVLNVIIILSNMLEQIATLKFIMKFVMLNTSFE